MPSKSAHIAAATENQKAIDYLCKEIDSFSPWIVSIAFYKGLHVIEAVFAGEKPEGHADTHGGRHRILKTTNRYQNLWKNYCPLWQASLVARYLRENENAPTYDVSATEH